jgi:tropomyosin
LKSNFVFVIIRVRSLELEVEKNFRQVKQAEADRQAADKKFEEMLNKYNAIKAELDSTLKGLEDL